MLLIELSKKMCIEDIGVLYLLILEYVCVYVCVYSVDLFLKVLLRLNIYWKFY